MPKNRTTVVITDANVLINFLLINQLPLLGRLPSHRFVVPDEVLGEITEPRQSEQVASAIASGILGQLVVDEPKSLSLFAKLRGVMGRGEAACLALAVTTDSHIASDEKKRFYKSAAEMIGASRILRTEMILIEAIRQGCISVAEADAFRAILAANRYVMPFASFANQL